MSESRGGFKRWRGTVREVEGDLFHADLVDEDGREWDRHSHIPIANVDECERHLIVPGAAFEMVTRLDRWSRRSREWISFAFQSPEFLLATDIADDWTINPATGRTNSSPQFAALVDEVERLIQRNGGSCLDSAWVRATAGLIMAQLAHVHHLAPRVEPDAGARMAETP